MERRNAQLRLDHRVRSNAPTVAAAIGMYAIQKYGLGNLPSCARANGTTSPKATPMHAGLFSGRTRKPGFTAISTTSTASSSAQLGQTSGKDLPTPTWGITAERKTAHEPDNFNQVRRLASPNEAPTANGTKAESTALPTNTNKRAPDNVRYGSSWRPAQGQQRPRRNKLAARRIGVRIDAQAADIVTSSIIRVSYRPNLKANTIPVPVEIKIRKRTLSAGALATPRFLTASHPARSARAARMIFSSLTVETENPTSFSHPASTRG